LLGRGQIRSRHVFVSCGEASGDRYAAALLSALRDRDPELRCTALGGDELATAGAEIVQPAAPLSVMGYAQIVTALPQLLRARKRIWRHLATADIDLVVPIDFPGLNLRLAGRAHRLGLPVFYLVPPQMWAWGAWRLGALRRNVDRIGTILPFERDWYAERGLDVFSMGHPLMEDYGRLDLATAVAARERRLADAQRELVLLLLPGSRRQEVRRLAPVLKVAAALATAWLAPRPLRTVVSRAPGIDAVELARAFGDAVAVRGEPVPKLLAEADLALVCSGTASLETALAGVPHELVYRTSRFDYAVARRLVRTERIGLANLILGTDLVREHLQDAATPVAMVRGLFEWLRDGAARTRFYGEVDRLRRLCGEPGVWQRTANALLELIERTAAKG
jgi:lipid-A-disaccharide synthase